VSGEAGIMADELRAGQRRAWLARHCPAPVEGFEPASEDASFRRYFRVRTPEGSLILMDAPPAREDMRPFVEVARHFHAIGLNVPELVAVDLEQGFLLLSDLGDRLYLDALSEATVERLYGDALGALLIIQGLGDTGALPAYDRDLLLAEMGLFRDWLVGRHLGMTLDDAGRAMLSAAFDLLADSALEQPQVCVHRDYHSRNLMVTARNNPGILDFQDAVTGPVTYDLVSLLRDCYIAWPRARVEDWALGYKELAEQGGVLVRDAHDEETFLRWFDWMGVQRHLKAAGIFARLLHRDGKPGYIGDIPRTLGYVVEVCDRYPELAALGGWRRK
jgi:aminoglycoside/choline kinase family phosphotransferase